MSESPCIQVEKLGKCYHIYRKPKDRLFQSIFRGKKQFYQEFWALKNVTFTVNPGEAVGIIGQNGSGKSSLLQLICDTLTPTEGTVKTTGKLAALLELGAGFNPEFSGRENVYLNGAILGFTKKDMEQRFQKIQEFADIGDFIEQPVKSYSSGMFVRLAFAVQACLEPNILIVDEALAVGDIFFQQKCIARIKDLLKKGTAVLFVSHDMNAIANLCDKAIWLHHGELAFIGDTNGAIEKYTASHYGYIDEKLQHSKINSSSEINIKQFYNIPSISATSLRFGNNKVLFTKFGIITQEHQSAINLKMGDKIKLILELEAKEYIPNLNIGFQIKDKFGEIAIGANTFMLKQNLAAISQGEHRQYGFEVELMLGVGDYTITLAVSENNEQPKEIYDWIEQVSVFRIIAPASHEKQVGGFAYCPINFISNELIIM